MPGREPKPAERDVAAIERGDPPVAGPIVPPAERPSSTVTAPEEGATVLADARTPEKERPRTTPVAAARGELAQQAHAILKKYCYGRCHGVDFEAVPGLNVLDRDVLVSPRGGEKPPNPRGPMSSPDSPTIRSSGGAWA